MREWGVARAVVHLVQVVRGVHVEHEGKQALSALAVEMRGELLEAELLGMRIGQNLVDVGGQAPRSGAVQVEQMVQPADTAAEQGVGIGGQEQVRVRSAEQVVAGEVLRAVVDDEEAVDPLAAVEIKQPRQPQMFVANACEQADLAGCRRDRPAVEAFEV